MTRPSVTLFFTPADATRLAEIARNVNPPRPADRELWHRFVTALENQEGHR